MLKRKHYVLGLSLIIMALLNVLIFKELWNYLIPELFGLKSITYFQSLGLFLLSKMLFKSSNDNYIKEKIDKMFNEKEHESNNTSNPEKQ
jgi:sensor histidine kinase YesM